MKLYHSERSDSELDVSRENMRTYVLRQLHSGTSLTA